MIFISVHAALLRAVPLYFDGSHSFIVQSSVLDVAYQVGSESQVLTVRATQILNDSRKWSNRISHLPGASTLLQAAYRILITQYPDSIPLLTAGLSSPFLLLQREAIARLDRISIAALETMLESLFILIQCHSSSTELRILAVTLVLKCSLRKFELPSALLEGLMREHRTTLIQPLRLALLPLIVRLRSQVSLRLGDIETTSF